MIMEFDVAELNLLPDRIARGVQVVGREIALCRDGDEVFAVAGSCSYHPIPLDGAKLEDGLLTCQWYGAQFDVRTGEPVFLRSALPLATFPTAVRHGHVFIRLAVSPPPSTPEPGM